MILPELDDKSLRVLVVDDSEDDVELLLRELRRSGHRVVHRRVDTADGIRTALAADTWDVVLCDWVMPELDALTALATLNASGADLPCIIVSGMVGEETAVAALKAGAEDFVVKGRLARLPASIARGMREASVRRERSLAIERVLESERRLKAIFDQSAVGIAQTDLDVRVLSANQRFCGLVGRGMDEIRGLDLRDAAPPEDRVAIGAAFERVARGGSGVVLEHRYVRRDGSVVWVSCTVSGVVGASGPPAYAVAMVQDVSDRKRVEEELRAAVRVRDEFITIASHELNTPLTSLGLQLTSVTRAVRAAGGEAALGELPAKLSIATRQVERLAALVTSILDVTRMASGALVVRPSRVDLRELAAASVKSSSEAAARAKCSLSMRASEPVIGWWDAVALDRVVSNLLSNALKFGAGAPVEVELERGDGRARLVVRDRGLGIASDDQERIFGRFERAVSVQQYGGFGIGLWVCRALVEAHGGSIRVASAPGEGASFTVELPIAAEG